jgi:predicted O-methyltransferase YrrM
MRKLANLSLADAFRVVSRLPSLPPSLTAPASLSAVDLTTLLFPEVTPSSAEACRLEYLKDSKFFSTLNERMLEKRRRHIIWPSWSEFLYMAVRFSKPRVVVETGVFDGASSAVILRALAENEEGELVSIDLPARKIIPGSTDSMGSQTLPPDCEPGWLVPDDLRARYRLYLGDSKELLPKIFAERPRIDIFFHDSLHTFEHMYFEYKTAWPHLSEGGLLLSDDVLWSEAFHKFLKQQGKGYGRLDRLGAARK